MARKQANSEFNQLTYGNPTTFISNFVWENHDFWFVKMRILLGIWEYVEDGYEEQENVAISSNAQKQQLK